jgi:hypothetical protein
MLRRVCGCCLAIQACCSWTGKCSLARALAEAWRPSARKKAAANQGFAVAVEAGRAHCGVLVAAHKKSPSLPRSCFVSPWVVLTSLPATFSTNKPPTRRRQNGYRQKGGFAQDAPGQGWRWHGQRQGQGRELLQVRLPRPTPHTPHADVPRRDAKKVKKLNILTKGTAQRNAAGDVTKAAVFQSRERPSARIEPNRKWFTNTRVISQDALSAFRGAVQAQQKDPYSYLLKQNKLPMSLIKDDENKKNGLKQHQAKIAVETAPFSDTFGPKAQRKRPKLAVSSLLDLVGESDKMHETYLDRLEQARLASGAPVDDGQQAEADGALTAAREAIFSKGQSKRIWNELYKVIDSSDVVIHVLDARDPLGTRCRSVEKYIREEAPHKHLLFVLNKCDLIPTSVAVSPLPPNFFSPPLFFPCFVPCQR